MDVTFKLADRSDTELVLSFIEDFHKFGGLPFDGQAIRKALENLIEDSSLGYAWLIYAGEVAVGYAVLCLGYSLEFHGRDAFIDELYIIEDYRRRGIGTQALEFLEKTCRSIGVNALHLEVDRDDLAAQAFYRKAAYYDHDRYLMTKWINK